MSGIISQNIGRSSGLLKAPASAAAAWTLIKTLTADGSATTMSFVNGASDVVLDGTYDTYKFIITNLHPQTDQVTFSWQGSTDTGSSYGVSTTNTNTGFYHNESDSSAAMEYHTGGDLSNSTSEIALYGNGSTGNDNDQNLSSEIILYSPSSTTYTKNYLVNNQHNERSDYLDVAKLAGYFNTTSAIDAIRFSVSSGNIDAGTISLLGIG
jgi:hypothetical protein